MTKTQAHAILDRIKSGDLVSLAATNQALERTGDIPRLSGQSLFADGHEQGNNRPRKAHDQVAEVGFSYSQYLDKTTTERTA